MDLGAAFHDGWSQNLITKMPLGFTLLFCRIGACIMLAPGVSSAQIPMQIRLFLALITTAALTPLLISSMYALSIGDDPILICRLIITESLIGSIIGILGRLFLLAFETLAVGVAAMLGYANPFGVELEPNQALSPLATFLTLVSAVLIFAGDLHWEVLRGLVASYAVIPFGSAFPKQIALRQASETFVEALRLSLRVMSPFFLFAITVNLAMSLINRLTPQVAIYYICTPFLLMGGLLLLYFTAPALLLSLNEGLGHWLSTGG